MGNDTEQSRVLTSALMKAVEKLGLSNDSLVNIIGVDLEHRNTLDPETDQASKAALLIRLSIALEILCGGDVELMHRYMQSHNKLTNDIPENQIQNENGLVFVLDTVEALLQQ